MKLRESFTIVFMGTPAFAVPTLESLHIAGYQIKAVVTSADKPAGRGLRPRPSDVKNYAEKHKLTLLQPASLKEEGFIKALSSINADLFVVVAFRMLPEVVWKLPPYGTINLHASLLPQYRGAAPINWAIIVGESKTGVSTFFINHDIDTGNILMQEETDVGKSETAGELHDRLMEAGARLVLMTVDAIREKNIKPVNQSLLMQNGEILKKAPKIFKEDCRINWNNKSADVYNLIKGLSPYPTARTVFLAPDGIEYQAKIFNAVLPGNYIQASNEPGAIITDAKNRMFIGTADGFIEVTELQLAGRSRMKVSDFLNGFRVTSGWSAN